MQGTAVHCGGYKAGSRNSKEPNTRQLEDIAWIINWLARLYGFGWKQVGTQRLTRLTKLREESRHASLGLGFRCLGVGFFC